MLLSSGRCEALFQPKLFCDFMTGARDEWLTPHVIKAWVSQLFDLGVVTSNPSLFPMYSTSLTPTSVVTVRTKTMSRSRNSLLRADMPQEYSQTSCSAQLSFVPVFGSAPLQHHSGSWLSCPSRVAQVSCLTAEESLQKTRLLPSHWYWLCLKWSLQLKKKSRRLNSLLDRVKPGELTYNIEVHSLAHICVCVLRQTHVDIFSSGPELLPLLGWM